MTPQILDGSLQVFPVSNAQETSHKSQKMITLLYEDSIDREEITVPRITDLLKLSEQQQVQEVIAHIKSVIGRFLNETKTGQKYFVLHGSVAMVINMLNQVPASDVRDTEIECGRARKYYFPVFDDEQSDLDFVCSKRDINITSIISLLEKSLEGYSDRCNVFSSCALELTKVVKDQKICKDRRPDALLVTGRTQKIYVVYKNENILSLDITYPPKEELPRELECRPYCKQSEKIFVKFGGCGVEINVCSFEQLIDDLRNAVFLTSYREGHDNKFLCRMETLLALSFKGLLKEDVANRVLCIADVKGQKCVESLDKGTQLTKIPTKGKKTNKGKKEEAELKDICTQVSVENKSKGTSTLPKIPLGVETDVCRRCDSDGLTLEKAFSEVAVQTTVKKSQKVPKSVKGRSDTQKSDATIDDFIQANLKKIRCYNVAVCKTQKEGGVSYKQLKETLDIGFLLCRYEKLIEAVVEGLSMSMLHKKTIIDVFEESTKRFCAGVIELKENLRANNDSERYGISALISARCIEVGFMNVKLLRASNIHEPNKDTLCAKVKEVELFYFNDVLNGGKWILSIENPERYRTQLECFLKVLSGHCKELCVMYLNNSLLYTENPGGLSHLIDLFFAISGEYRDDIYLEHIESYLKDEDYRKVQNTYEKKLSNIVQRLEDLFTRTANPLSFCAKILPLSKLAYTKGFYLYAGVLLAGHLKQMVENKAYRKECHRVGVFQSGASQSALAIYKALECSEDERNADPQFCKQCMGIRKRLFDLSEMLTSIIFDESGTIDGGQWNWYVENA